MYSIISWLHSQHRENSGNLKDIYKTILLQNYLFGNINGDKNSRKIHPSVGNNLILYFSNEFELKRYICFSCNIKRYKTTAKLSENTWNKRHSKHFQRRHLWRQHLYCYCFFLLLNRNQKCYILVSDRILQLEAPRSLYSSPRYNMSIKLDNFGQIKGR